MATERIRSRTRWVIALCSAGALAVMSTLIVLPRQGEPPAGHETRSANQPYRSSREASGAPTGTAGEERARAAFVPAPPEEPVRVRFLFAGTEFDFGTVRQGVKLERTIGFENTGTGPLYVFDVKTDCGCLKVEHLAPRTKRYEPGEQGQLKLSVDTTRRHGVIRKQVTLLCNDPQSPPSSFRVTMDISAGLVFAPSYLNFGVVVPNRRATSDFWLRSPKTDGTWEVLGLEGGRKTPDSKPIAYTYKVVEQFGPRFTWFVVTVTHPGFGEASVFTDSIIVRTSHPARPSITVPARLCVVPDIRSLQPFISLGDVRSGNEQSPARTRVLAGAADITFKITSVEVRPPEGATAGPAGSGFLATFGSDAQGWWVDVKYDGKNRRPRPLDAVLLVRTDYPQQPELRVPIRATVRAPRQP